MGKLLRDKDIRDTSRGQELLFYFRIMALGTAIFSSWVGLCIVLRLKNEARADCESQPVIAGMGLLPLEGRAAQLNCR